jgi:2-polyprenyl-3-methyl-5-hydroxy-6-metoxy-1,4-benzoquinol methylase
MKKLKSTPWYQQLFTNYSNTYDLEIFTQGTTGEVDFFEKEFDYNKEGLILDIACGTGRHAIELAKRGYKIEGFDLSDNQISKAREKAQASGVNVKFFKADAREFNAHEQYNHAIMICEGGFSLMETDEMNAQILTNAYASLKKGGKLIFTCLNALFPLYHSVQDFLNQDQTSSNGNTFDLMTFRNYSEISFIDDDNVPHTIKTNERFYVPSEITWLLQSSGFQKSEIFGAKLGNFSREHILTTDDYEMLIIAKK